MYNSLTEYLRGQSLLLPHKTAVSDEHGSLTFSQLYAASMNIAAAIQFRTDGMTGAPVILLAEKSTLSYAMLNGILCSGNCYVPIDTKAPPESLRYIVGRLDARAAVTTSALAEKLTAAGFEKIIQTDIIFPPFQEYDREYIASGYFSADRYKMLENVVFDNTAVCVDAKDILINSMTGTAEVLKNKTKLTQNEIIIKIDRGAFTAEDGFPADAAALSGAT